VLGEVKPSALGRTLTHEHVSMQFVVCFVPPLKEEKHLSDVDWSLEASGWIRQNP
jgi:phosphotriesterase-related protein